MEQRFYQIQVQMKSTKEYLQKLLKEILYPDFRKLSTITKEVTMMPTPISNSPDFENMTKPEKYRHFLRRRFQELENSYYAITDELTQKLADLDGVNKKLIPDLDIRSFSFIKEWQYGDISSKQVLTILKSQNPIKTAETQLTRRLTNYMIGKEGRVCDYILPCRELIMRTSVPLYIRYLGFLQKYFEVLTEIDAAQEKITWIEQVHDKDGAIKMKAQDMPLNQAIHQIEHQVIPFNNHKYFLGKNMICLDEDMAQETTAIHYICAPQCYIEELKKMFKVKDEMDLKTDAEYIKRIIGVYVK